MYNEKFLATLQRIRPHLVVSDLDLHFNNLLVSNVDFHSFRNKANIWAKEYFQTIGECDIPLNMIRQSSQALRQSKSVPVFIHLHVQPLWPKDGISVESIDSVCGRIRSLVILNQVSHFDKMGKQVNWVQFLEDVQIATRFARDGIPVFVDPLFQSSSENGPWPRQYRESMLAINAHITSNCKAGLGFVVSKEVAEEFIPKFHLQGLGFAEAAGKVKGRLTCNLTSTASRNKELIPMNTDWVKKEAIRRYTDIHHPTLIDICGVIVFMQNIHGKDNVVIFKEDVRGYFTLCRFASWGVRLMAFAIHSENSEIDGAVYLSTNGNFGWTGLPFGYEVFTRVFRVIINYLIKGGTTNVL